jgi:hypothetical protein
MPAHLFSGICASLFQHTTLSGQQWLQKLMIFVEVVVERRESVEFQYGAQLL